MNKIILLSLFVISGFYIIDANAENKNNFIIDGYTITTFSDHITDISLNWDSKDLDLGTITFDESINGTIKISIPKEMPRLTNLDFGHFSLHAIQTDGSWSEIKETESNCYYHLEIPVNNSDYVEIIGGSVAAGTWESVTILDPSCVNFTLKQQIVNGENETGDEQQYEEGQILREYFDGVTYPHDYNIENGNLVDYRNDLKTEALIFNVNGTDGTFAITFPKSVPFDWRSDGFTHDLFVIVNRAEVDFEEFITACDYMASVEFSGYTQIEIYVARSPEGPSYVYRQLDDACLQDERYNTDIQKKLQQKPSCSGEDVVRAINLHDEVVCVFPHHFSKLYHYGYLKAKVAEGNWF